jgi:hypothetical protein
MFRYYFYSISYGFIYIINKFEMKILRLNSLHEVPFRGNLLTHYNHMNYN